MISQPAVKEDNEEEPSPPKTPPRAVVKKTAKPTKKKTSPIRKSPRAHSSRPTQSQILAEKMRIGASIIPGAVTVSQYTHIHA